MGGAMLAILLLPAAAVAATNLLVAARSSSVAPTVPASRPPGTNVVLLQPAKASVGPNSSLMMLQAWKAYEKKEYEKVFVVADECVRLFGPRAARQQASLDDFPDRTRAANYSSLNDVATCLFIKGKSLRDMRCTAEAKEVFREVMRSYRYAQCWDPKGWFWKVAVAAQDEIHCIDYGVDFGSYSSEVLTAKAWKAMQAGRYDAMELYVRKCIELYGEVAREMQSSLAEYAQGAGAGLLGVERRRHLPLHPRQGAAAAAEESRGRAGVSRDAFRIRIRAVLGHTRLVLEGGGRSAAQSGILSFVVRRLSPRALACYFPASVRRVGGRLPAAA